MLDSIIAISHRVVTLANDSYSSFRSMTSVKFVRKPYSVPLLWLRADRVPTCYEPSSYRAASTLSKRLYVYHSHRPHAWCFATYASVLRSRDPK